MSQTNWAKGILLKVKKEDKKRAKKRVKRQAKRQARSLNRMAGASPVKSAEISTPESSEQK